MAESVLPLRNRLNQPFWDGAAAGTLVLPRCVAHDRFFWPPSPISPFTGGPIDWALCDPTGTVESLVVYRRPFQQAFAHLVPYGIALVALDCGVRLMGHVRNPGEPQAPSAGERVKLHFEPLLPDGLPLPVVHRTITG